MIDTAKKTISKHEINPIHLVISANFSPASSLLVILTEPITTGVTNGYNKIGNMISLVFKLDAKEDNKVPKIQNPIEPKNITNNNGNKTLIISTLKKIMNTGRINISITLKNKKLLIILPK